MKQSELHYPVNFVIAVFQDLKESFKVEKSLNRIQLPKDLLSSVAYVRETLLTDER